jgi:hypothetical protein
MLMRGSRVGATYSALLVVLLALDGCTSTSQAASRAPTARASPSSQPSSEHRPSAGRQPRLRAFVKSWRLPEPLSREVVFVRGRRLDIVGGLTANGSTTAAVMSVDPRTGTSHAARAMVRATHDAGGAYVAGHETVFGGGSSTSQSWIQRRGDDGRWAVVGRLPTPRSDLSAVAVGSSAYLIGGYDGRRLDPSILQVSPGGSVEVRGRLPVPVRYPAVTTLEGAIWVVGGLARAGPSTAVQRIDLTTGHAAVVGHVPDPVVGAVALALGGDIVVCGGAVAGAPTTQILRIDPSSGRAMRIGRLPMPVSYSAAGVIGDAGFLVGGETPVPSSRVVELSAG